MDIATFSQLGIGLATLFILWLVVRYFIEAIGKKDEYIQKIVMEFNTTINNHIDHATQAQTKQIKSLDALTRAVNRLTATSKIDRSDRKEERSRA